MMMECDVKGLDLQVLVDKLQGNRRGEEHRVRSHQRWEEEVIRARAIHGRQDSRWYRNRNS